MKFPFHLQALADAKWYRDDVVFVWQHMFARHKVDDLVKKVRAESSGRPLLLEGTIFVSQECSDLQSRNWSQGHQDLNEHQLMDCIFLGGNMM